MNSQKAFTLLEVVVVMIIVAVLASIALPRYNKTVDRSLEDSAILNLKSIHAANEVYESRSGGYYPGVENATSASLTEINANMGLSIIGNDIVYTCTGPVGGASYTCTAVAHSGTGNQFTVRVTQADIAPGDNPCCSTGSCPNPDNQC